MSTRPTCHAAGPSEVKRTARRLIPNPINSCANGSGIPNLRQMPWSRMHKDSWELVLDHLGLVAGMFDELGIGDVRDKATQQNPAMRDRTVGEAVKAMVLNGL